MAPTVFHEEKNLLICGTKACGKTSLAFTLARGIFPEEIGIRLGRFEGWSIGASATQPQASLTASASTASTCSTASNSSMSSVKKEKFKPYFVNFTFWEDRPRLNLARKASVEPGTIENDPSPSAIGQDDPQQQVQQQPLQEIQADDNRAAGIERKVNHQKGQALSIGSTSTIIAKNGKLPGKSSTTEVNENNENKQGPAAPGSMEEGPHLEGYRPSLIWPVPQPHTLLLCYSSADKESFQKAESEIFPEISEQFPNVPVILVATKSDLKERAHLTAAAAAAEMNEEIKNDIISSEMGRTMALKIGARAFVECSAKLQVGLRQLMEEAVWIAFDDWFRRKQGQLSGSCSQGCPGVSDRTHCKGAYGDHCHRKGRNESLPLKQALASTLSNSWSMSQLWSSSTSSSWNLPLSESLMLSSTQRYKSDATSNDSDGAGSEASGLASSSSSLYRKYSHEMPRPAINIQDPFSASSFPGTPSSMPGSGNRQQHKQAYGRSAVKKIWQSYGGGGGGGGSS